MAYVVTAKWTAKQGEEEAVAAAIRKVVGPSRAEPGIIFYQPHRDPENPTVFFFYEQFGDAIPRLESRERSFYETWEPA